MPSTGSIMHFFSVDYHHHQLANHIIVIVTLIADIHALILIDSIFLKFPFPQYPLCYTYWQSIN